MLLDTMNSSTLKLINSVLIAVTPSVFDFLISPTTVLSNRLMIFSVLENYVLDKSYLIPTSKLEQSIQYIVKLTLWQLDLNGSQRNVQKDWFSIYLSLVSHLTFCAVKMDNACVEVSVEKYLNPDFLGDRIGAGKYFPRFCLDLESKRKEFLCVSDLNRIVPEECVETTKSMVKQLLRFFAKSLPKVELVDQRNSKKPVLFCSISDVKNLN
ncbi:hypothetical protein HK098_007025 [Nowakowskiella sp. JEL0407]|nr:hypothetical protein HK098_007025 [Nowakowskiella sp. JEL0407]